LFFWLVSIDFAKQQNPDPNRQNYGANMILIWMQFEFLTIA